MTDSDVLTEMQYALIETPDGGVTVSSGLWTPTEMHEALTSAQQWLMRELWPVVSTATLITVPNQPRHPLPQDWMETIRVAYTTPDGSTASLGRDSSWSADYLDYDWTYNLSSTPLIYSDSDAPVPSIQIMPVPSDAGILSIWYVAIPPLFAGSGVDWVLPDCLIPPCKWRALAILLGKDGRGQDLPRAAWAEARAQEGLEAGKLMLGGWRAGFSN